MSRRRTNVEEFDPARVRPLPDQPRKRFRGIPELAESIREIGQQSAGIVTLVADDPKFDAQLVDGERRLRACKVAGVPFRAEVRAAADAEEIFAASFASNFGKQDHDCIEVAEALDRLRRSGKTWEQLARIAGRTMGWVGHHLALLKLHPDVRAMMIPEDDEEKPRLTLMLAQLLAPIDDHAKQIALAKKITNGDGLSLAAARRLILRERAAAGDDAGYVRNAGTGRTLRRIESILEDLSDRMGVYLDMPGPEFNRLIDSADVFTRRQLVKLLNDAGESLADLADAVQKRIPAVGLRRAVS
jgi:ParB/RepB/Spo0J family partition protein